MPAFALALTSDSAGSRRADAAPPPAEEAVGTATASGRGEGEGAEKVLDDKNGDRAANSNKRLQMEGLKASACMHACLSMHPQRVSMAFGHPSNAQDLLLRDIHAPHIHSHPSHPTCRSRSLPCLVLVRTGGSPTTPPCTATIVPRRHPHPLQATTTFIPTLTHTLTATLTLTRPPTTAAVPPLLLHGHQVLLLQQLQREPAPLPVQVLPAILDRGRHPPQRTGGVGEEARQAPAPHPFRRGAIPDAPAHAGLGQGQPGGAGRAQQPCR